MSIYIRLRKLLFSLQKTIKKLLTVNYFMGGAKNIIVWQY